MPTSILNQEPGSFGDYNTYVTFKDPRFAFRLFHGQHSANTTINNYPKHKFSYYVHFVKNPNAVGGSTYSENGLNNDGLTFHAQTVNQPSFKFEAEKLNQYNRWRIMKKKVMYEPVTITLLDTRDERVFKFFQDYLSYYVKEQRKTEVTSGGHKTKWEHDIVSDVFNGDTDGPGYGVQSLSQKFYLSCIEIYHINPGAVELGNQDDDGGLSVAQTGISKITLVNPIITNIQLDSMEYASSDPPRHQVTFDYEVAYFEQINSSVTQANITTGAFDKHGMEEIRPTSKSAGRQIQGYSDPPVFSRSRSLFDAVEDATNVERGAFFDEQIGEFVRVRNQASAITRATSFDALVNAGRAESARVTSDARIAGQSSTINANSANTAVGSSARNRATISTLKSRVNAGSRDPAGFRTSF